ncbi:MAG TPA: hypothetical protein VGA21_11285 [Cyclobacteriaceae bacterium]|jgi:hypothetical protein
MKNKILLICLFFCQAAYLGAMNKPSVYDPLGKLSTEERNRIEAEGRTLSANRKVNGQDLIIQIDFMSEDEFEEGGVTGRDESGLTLFSLGTYINWSLRYFSQPAVLMLFLDQGNGNYVLDALNFSDMLMDEGIPDLVRRYIRDEIMKKENSYTETISSGLYAIGEALNPTYRERLEQKGNEMLNTDDRYHRAHCVYGDCHYYEFTPEEKSVLGPTQPKDAITFHGLPESRPDNLTSVVNEIVDWGYTHENEIASNWPWIYDNNENKYQLNAVTPTGYFTVKKDNPWSVLNTISNTKDIGELLPTMGWLQIHGWRATYCNFFAQDLSYYVLGHLPWATGTVANKIHDYIVSSQNFIGIPKSEINTYVDNGFMVYITINQNPAAGHIAMGWMSNAENKEIIQAGRTTGILMVEEGFGDEVDASINLYLGFLKKVI